MPPIIMMAHPLRCSCATCRAWPRSASTRTPPSCPHPDDEDH